MRFTDEDGDVVEDFTPEETVIATNSEVIGYLAEAMKKNTSPEIVDRIVKHSEFILKLSADMIVKPAGKLKAIK